MSQAGIITPTSGGGSGTLETLTGDTGGPVSPLLGNINVVGGGGVTVTGNPVTATLTITASGGFTWNEVTATSSPMAVNNGYVTNNAILVTLTLPVNAAFGSIFRVAGKGAGGWVVAQNASQTIVWDAVTATTVGTGGSIASLDRYDALEFICITANTTFAVLTAKGNLVVT